MSGLSYICDYGNESESDDCEIEDRKSILKKPKLPVPNLSNIVNILPDIHSDNPELYQGRIRRFPHVRGNWATFVYIEYPEEQSLLALATKLKTLLFDFKESCHVCEDFHLSLSKTVVLNYHTITSFNQSLKEALIDCESILKEQLLSFSPALLNRELHSEPVVASSQTTCKNDDSKLLVKFFLGFDNIEVFCNDDKTRTFIVLKADYFSKKSLLPILDKVNDVLGEFKLEKFYEDPSFHISLLWTNGDHRTKLRATLESLSDTLNQDIEKTFEESVVIDKVNCKTGNKYFQFSLV